MLYQPNCAYLLVVDTDKYAGNFERELTGFCTGVHDDTHGDEEAADYHNFLNISGKVSTWNDIIQTCDDEDGYPRVCTAWPTPGRLNNGMGYCYDVGSDEEIAKAKEAMREYQKTQIKMCQDRLDNEDFENDRPGAWTKEACERTISSALQSIERAGENVGYPAYESVAIFLTAHPSTTDMAIFLERLRDFADNMMEYGKRCGKKLVIKNVRIIKYSRSEEEFVVVWNQDEQ